ncbi:Zn-dependent oligopeptidase [Hymenobacter sp. BT186]|uniref:Zn-dependent oligopeptidase n=1 Tax=Hymenobacter telluris TaxID=2816474 RepID=A0A939JD74_9BACT|nr:M3 family metallopeptidase [Hymenobacter telluris]MBO0360956.1 Zn-dependent oligopeptidase [Hymenobacter telluris]MBW3376984.1 Zn-dependent oligopeptidase [Hymenobacter norwichensis]
MSIHTSFAPVRAGLTLVVSSLTVLSVSAANPLMPAFNQPIAFSKVTKADVQQATATVIAGTKTSLNAIYSVPTGKRTFTNTMVALDNLSDDIDRVAGPISILFNASPDSTIRNQAQKSLAQISKYGNELALDEKLYRAIKDYSKSKEALALTGARKKFVTETIEEYERNGFALTPEKRKELQKLNDKIGDLSIAFGANIAKDQSFLMVSEADMKGLPEDFKKSRTKAGDAYRITVDGPTYSTFMKYAESEPMRKQLYTLYNNRAADTNLEVLKQLLIERQKKAQLLGYKTYAAYQTSSRMAKTPETVWAFETKLVDRVKQKSQQDLEELLVVKRAYLKDPSVKTIAPWESSFYSNLLMKDKYQLDAEKVKEYFEVNHVVDGLFQTTQQLFGLKFNEVKDASVWHKDARMFEVQRDGKLIGRFYLDLFPRDNKYTHAACFGIESGKATAKGYQLPTAALLCNFNAPTPGKPALMSHSQVVTFFHEFGHVMHNLVTTVELSSQSGTSVKRDFVEAPSQILENWAWNYDALKTFAKHYQTGEVLPKPLYDKMWAARNVGSGIGASQQILYGTLDMTLHDKFDPNGTETTTEVLKKLQNQITPFAYLDGTNMQAAFGHLTGYGAGYYGYMWSKVYAEDMFSVFEKNGVMDQKTGLRYRDLILAKGGTDDEYQLVKNFLGREPNQEAFFKSLGL